MTWYTKHASIDMRVKKNATDFKKSEMRWDGKVNDANNKFFKLF